MAENLITSRFNCGISIPLIKESIVGRYTIWDTLTTPACSWYCDDKTIDSTYGLLYNWYAVSEYIHSDFGIAPTGWHVPSDSEWATLVSYLGGVNTAGDALRESGSLHWLGSIVGTNISGFTALPGGTRNARLANCSMRGIHGDFWTSTPALKTSNAWIYDICCGPIQIWRASALYQTGASIRCIKN
jgi:uncharacterized protein (TIGR02145 family)